MKVEALDHKNNKAKASIITWQIRVSRWYSINSNKTHMTVATPSTPADTFLFLHKKISAAGNPKRRIIQLNIYMYYSEDQTKLQLHLLNQIKDSFFRKIKSVGTVKCNNFNPHNYNRLSYVVIDYLIHTKSPLIKTNYKQIKFRKNKEI